jgi:hypothetical protein
MVSTCGLSSIAMLRHDGALLICTVEGFGSLISAKKNSEVE